MFCPCADCHKQSDVLEGEHAVRYHVLIELQVDGPLDDLDAHTDQLADALDELHDVVDPDLGATPSTGRLDVTMVAEAENLEDATQRSLTATRAAIHVAGGTTAGWERMIREVGTRARKLADA